MVCACPPRKVYVTVCLGVLRQSRSFGGTDEFGVDALMHCPAHLLMLFASLADLPELAFAELFATAHWILRSLGLESRATMRTGR